jgi:molybdopterin/thiamine biosynthesis adenylyltransferase
MGQLDYNSVLGPGSRPLLERCGFTGLKCRRAATASTSDETLERMALIDRLSPTNDPPVWSYGEAFSRNRGLIGQDEQERLRRSRAAVVGLGGVGGIDLVALARLGIGRFTIADPDTFEIRNTNRQYGAMCSSQGRNKADVMCEIVRDINPEAEIRVFREPIGVTNADAFLADADVLVDGIDAFEIDLRRLLFRKARERGIYALGAGPVGFSTVWVVFGPHGMSFDRYFDLVDGMNPVEQFVAYVIGMAPSSLQRRYMDLSYLDVTNHTGPSAGLACHLASGVVAAEVLKILLQRGWVYEAPFYHQFDAYLGRLVRRRLIGGNRNLLQRIKRRWLTHYITKRLQPQRDNVSGHSS